jgi:hypothetical protein
MVGYVMADLSQGLATVVGVLSRGQLALLATALAARGMGELIAAKREAPAMSMALAGISVAVMLFSALFYERATEVTLDPMGVAKYSAGTYVFAMASSLGCALIASERKA